MIRHAYEVYDVRSYVVRMMMMTAMPNDHCVGVADCDCGDGDGDDGDCDDDDDGWG